MDNDTLQLALDILRCRLEGLKGSFIFDIEGEHIETNFDQKFQIDSKIVAKKCSRIFDLGKRISQYDRNIVKLEHIIVAGSDYSFFITPISPKLLTFVLAEDKIGDIHFHTSRGDESEVGIKDHLVKWVNSYHYGEVITENNSFGLPKNSIFIKEIENQSKADSFKKLLISFLKETSKIYILDKPSNVLYNILSNSDETSNLSNYLFDFIYKIHDLIGHHTNNPLLSIEHITLWGVDETGKEGLIVIFDVDNRYSLVISSQNSLGEVLFWCKHILSEDINKLLTDKDYSLSTIDWNQEKINLINEGEQTACSPQECAFSMLINCEEKLPFGQPHTIAKYIDMYEIPDIGTTLIDQASDIWDRLYLGELWKIVLIGSNVTTSLAPIGKSKELGFVSTSGQDFNFLDEPVNQSIGWFRKAFNKEYTHLNLKSKDGNTIPDFSKILNFSLKNIYLGFYGIYDLKPGYKLKIKEKDTFIKNDLYHNFDHSFKFIEKILVFNHYALNTADDELQYIIIKSGNAGLVYKLGILEGIHYFIACIFDERLMRNCENLIDKIDSKIKNDLINKQKFRTEIIPLSQAEDGKQLEHDPPLPSSVSEQKALIVSKLYEEYNYKVKNATQFYLSGGEFDLILEQKTPLWKRKNYAVVQIVKVGIGASHVLKFINKCDKAKNIDNIKMAYLITSNGIISKEADDLKNEYQSKLEYKLLIKHLRDFATRAVSE
jgi:predicted regulator of Ras-like GTPase activity (Roadblock/LC7/MglB family)